MFTDANEASLRLATGVIGDRRIKQQQQLNTDPFNTFPSISKLQQTGCIQIYTHGCLQEGIQSYNLALNVVKYPSDDVL